MNIRYATLAYCVGWTVSCTHLDLPPQVALVEPAYRRVSEWESKFDAEWYDSSSELNHRIMVDQIGEERTKVSDGLWLLANNTDRAQARAKLASLARKYGVNQAYIELAPALDLPVDQTTVERSPYLSRVLPRKNQ